MVDFDEWEAELEFAKANGHAVTFSHSDAFELIQELRLAREVVEAAKIYHKSNGNYDWARLGKLLQVYEQLKEKG